MRYETALWLGFFLVACDEPQSFRLDAARDTLSAEASLDEFAEVSVSDATEAAMEASLDVPGELSIDVVSDAADVLSEPRMDAPPDVPPDTAPDAPPDVPADAGPPPRVELVSVALDGRAGNGPSDAYVRGISRDGRYVVFSSSATNLVSTPVPVGVAQIYLRDIVDRRTTLVSVDAAGQPFGTPCGSPVISADGNTVAFATAVRSGDQIHVWRRATGETTALRSTAGTVLELREASPNGLSQDGTILVFRTRTRIEMFPENGEFQSYEINLTTGASSYRIHSVSTSNTLASPPLSPYCGSTEVGAGANMASLAVTADARYVVFEGNGVGIVGERPDEDSCPDFFLHDRNNRSNARANIRMLGGSSLSYFIHINADGSQVLFQTSSQLVPLDNNTKLDLYVSSPGGGMPELVSQGRGVVGNGDNYFGALSDNAQLVVFASNASNLVSGDNNGATDIFLRNRNTMQTTRISVTESGAELTYVGAGGVPTANMQSALSGNGTIALFGTTARATATDANAHQDVYLYRISP